MHSLSSPFGQTADQSFATSRDYRDRRLEGRDPAEPPEGYWLKSAALSLAIMTMAGLITYFPAISLEFGRADDYWLLLNNSTYSPGTHARVWMEAGRFLPALASITFFTHVDSVPELLQMRLIAVLALSTAAAAVSLLTLRLLDAPSERKLRALAIGVGLIVLATPAAPSAATWGVMAVQLWAIPLALGSGLAATANGRLMGMRWELVSGFLLFCSTFTYQPAAAACVLPPFMWSAKRWAQGDSAAWRRPLWMTSLLVVALASNYAIVRLFSWAGNERLGGHSLGDSLTWFLTEFLPRTIAFGVPTTIQSAGVSLIALIAALLTPTFLGRRYYALSASVVAAWLLTSAIVLPTELWASYRLLATSQIVLWCGAAACAVFTAQRWQSGAQRISSMPFFVLAAATILALMVTAGTRAYAYLAKPNAVDWRSVQCVLRQAPPLTDKTILVLTPNEASVSEVSSYDEYGKIGSSLVWALPDMVWLASRSIDGQGLPPNVSAAQLTPVESSAREARSTEALRFSQDVCGGLPSQHQTPYWRGGS